MKIEIDSKELLMLDAFRKMREIEHSRATNKQKEMAIWEIFIRANKMLDIEEGSEF